MTRCKYETADSHRFRWSRANVDVSRSRSVNEERCTRENRLQRETLDLIARDQIAKGNVFSRPRVCREFRRQATAHSFLFAILCPRPSKHRYRCFKGRWEVKCWRKQCAKRESRGSPGRRTVALLTILTTCARQWNKDMIISDVQLFERRKRCTAVHDRRCEKTRAHRKRAEACKYKLVSSRILIAPVRRLRRLGRAGLCPRRQNQRPGWHDRVF